MKSKSLSKEELLSITDKIEKNLALEKKEVEKFVDFEFEEKKIDKWEIIKKISFFASIIFGAYIVVYPDQIERLTQRLPDFLLLPERVALALDYLWSIIGNPTEKRHILYHLPNILLYSFGILGIRNLVQTIVKKNWKDRVREANEKLHSNIQKGIQKLKSENGFSILFLGSGDYVGESLARNENINTIVIANQKQEFTDIWNKYSFGSGINKLENVLENINAHDSGEYIFFPVVDNELFLPSKEDFDLAPYQLDTIISNLRTVERNNGWIKKRIIIVGDKYQFSKFYSADKDSDKKLDEDVITFEKISKNNEEIYMFDPTDVVIDEIIKVANGAKILFRASEEGIKRYKKKFFERLDERGYTISKPKDKLIVGYDIFEQQIEQQSIANKNTNYLPVILSQDIFDNIKKQSHTNHKDVLFIPSIILRELTALAKKDSIEPKINHTKKDKDLNFAERVDRSIID